MLFEVVGASRVVIDHIRHVLPTSKRAPLPVSQPACMAPSTSLLLDQRGFVRACASNHTLVLGSIVHQGLRALWDGPVAARLRDALAQGDMSLGCGGCAWQVSVGGEPTAFARQFDHLKPTRDALSWPTQIEFALGNTCNLACVMCNGEQSSTIRSRRERLPPQPQVYGEPFFAELAAFLPHLSSARFLGGEPFLVRAHHRVWDDMISIAPHVSCHVTTNGTIWNATVERVLEGLDVSLAVSLDGIRPATVEAIRVGADLRTILRNLDRFTEYTRARGTHLGLTFCLMRTNWQEFDEFLCFADDRDLDVYVNSVAAPGSLSLYRLSEPELAVVVVELERRDRKVRATVGRNLRVWEDQLGRLRSHLAMMRRREDEDPLWPMLHGISRAHGELAVDVPAIRDEALREAAEWADNGTVLLIDINPWGTVTAAESTTGGGPTYLASDLNPVGMGVEQLIELLESMYGRVVDLRRSERADGTVEHLRTYEDHDVRVEVRSVVGVWQQARGGEDGSWQVIAARPAGRSAR